MSTRYNFTQKGSGLLAQGLSTNPAEAYKTYQSIAANPNTPQNKGILSGIQAYSRNNPGSTSDPNWTTNAMDWYFRDNQRKSQKDNGFFSTTLGKVLGTVAQVGLGFVPVVGPALSAGFGAVQGGLSGGGIGGALLGGLGGYGAGKFGSSLATNGIRGTISNTLGGVKNFFNPAATNINSAFPSAYASRAATGASGLAKAAGGNAGGFFNNIFGSSGNGTAATSGGGGGMSFFGDILKQSIPSLISGGIQYAGNQNALASQQQAANQLQQNARFNPFNVSGPAGGAAFSGNNATANLSPELQAQLAQMDQATKGAFGDYNKFNAGDYSQNYYDSISGYKQPFDQAQTNDLLNRVYSSGNWGSTTGAQDVYSYQSAKNQEDNQLRIQAQQAGAQEQDRLFTRYFNSATSQQNLARSPYDFITQGGNLGGMSSNAAVGSNKYPWSAARDAAGASSEFWRTIGDSAFNAANAVVDKYSRIPSNNNRPITVQQFGQSLYQPESLRGRNS